MRERIPILTDTKGRPLRMAYQREYQGFVELLRETNAVSERMERGFDKDGAGTAFYVARKKAQLSQANVATAAGTSKQYVSRFERGQVSPSMATLKRLVERGLGKRLAVAIE